MRKGQIVAIRFLDHVEDGEGPMEFSLIGRVMAQDKAAVTIVCWDYLNPEDRDLSNMKTFNILKSCINDVAQLVRKDGVPI
tara:strand:- start:129 stop:371 length:243 start_codon:yes stop_codon:yes gene_type:complete